MEDPKKKSTFVFQAGILAAAGMLVKVIGLIYRSPLLSIIGIEGNGYYNSAINIYTIILLISSYSIPSAISKVISQRLAFKEYRNAQRVFVCALLYVLVVGGVASILTFVGAPFLVWKNQNAVVALRVLSPTIFFSGFLGVFRGFFQAHGSMVHTSISQILEQILNAAVSILAAKLLIGLVADGDATTRAIYGSAGSALGTGAGVLIGLLFMFGMYRLNSGVIRRRVERDKTWHEESYKEIFKVIFTIVTPFILSTFIYNCTTVVNMTIFYHVMDYKKVDAILASNHYGIFSGLAVAVVNIPIAIASAMSSAIIPGVAASYVKGTVSQTRKQVSRAIQMTMLIAIPAAVGLAVLPRPIMQFIFPQKESLDIASGLLAALAVTVVLYSLSTLTNAVLQGIGKVNTPVTHASVALVIQVAGLIALLLYTDLELYALAAANAIYSLVVCILNHISVRKHLEYRMDVVKLFLKPLFAAVIMGAAVYGVYHGLILLIPVSRMVLLIAIGIGVCVYGAVLLLIGGVSREELLAFPKGYTLVHIAERLHLLSDKPESGKKRKRRKKKKRRKKEREFMSRRRRLPALLLCLALFLAGCGGGKESGVSLKLTFLDTGKSDCIVIEAGESVVLNDTADVDDAAAICAYLDERGTTRIEYLILSHFDKDHIGGAAELITQYEVGCVLMPDYEEDSEPYLALVRTIEETDTAYERLQKDVSFSVDGVSFYVDAPHESVYENDNNYSLITCVTNGKNRFLLMGDAKKIRTGEFLSSAAAKEQYDLIKMPHHGNYTKNLETLFETAKPRYAVLTADPERLRVEEETVALLNEYECEVYYTDEGVVTAVSDGEQVQVSQTSVRPEISESIAME